MRAAVYCRLSLSSEASTSIERQRLACEQLAAARGWEVVQVEEDVDVSATHRRLDRPGLQRIRDNYPTLDAVIYWKTDRLARSLLDYAALLDEADQAGVALVSATEPLDLSSPMGRAMAQVVAIFAELEARTIGMRAKSSIEHLRRVGRAPGGRLPYGWHRVENPDGPGYVVALDPDAAPVLREAVDRVLAGEALLAVARDFTARGIPTVNGSAHWNPATLRTLLRNPALIGRTVHHGTVLRDDDGLPVAHRPSLVSSVEWRDLQAAMDARSRPDGRTRAGRPLLSGLARCGRCGGLLAGQSRRYKDRRRTYYACGASGQGLECSGVTVSRPELDAYVAQEFLATWGRRPVVRVVQVAPPSASDAEIAEVRNALDDLERDRYVLGLFRDEDGTRRFAELHGRLSARLATLQAEGLPSLPDLVRTGQTYADAWTAATTDDARRDLLATEVSAVRVMPTTLRSFTPARVEIDWLVTPRT